MNRLSLINQIIKLKGFKTYLEIGCYKGNTFFKVDVDNKIAVDPYFHRAFYKQWILNKISGSAGKLYMLKMTSDIFFSKKQKFIKSKMPIDIALIDGLHTFEASLNDVLNTLNYLNKDGVIVLHDCNPPDAGAAMATKNFPIKQQQLSCSDWSGAWCGDVWKTIVYLKECQNNIVNVQVVDTDSGLGILTIEKPIEKQNLTIDKFLFDRINQMTFAELNTDKKDLLNLKKIDEFQIFLKSFINSTYSKNEC